MATASVQSFGFGNQTEFEPYAYYKRTDAVFSVPAGKNYVWYNANPKEPDEFSTAEVKSETGDDMVVRTPEGQEIKLKKKGTFPRNPARFDGVEDCAELSILNEPCVLHNLRLRYNANIIHTYSGLFCVVINPYKRFPIYTPFVIEKYRGRRRNELPPHIFAIADGAYRAMMQDHINQSILITGESGAGKTENTKKVIQFLAAIAGKGESGKPGLLEEQLLEANPILESFGNATTIANNNSSRFGKFIEIQFNSSGYIIGASINSYLLEKSRVVFQGNDERNYHVFYQLLAGASSDLKRALKLTGAGDYFYINQGRKLNVDGVDDAAEFNHLKKALSIMNVDEEDQRAIWSVVAGLLHLGNVEFKEGHGGAELKEPEKLAVCADLLGVNDTNLRKGLIEPRIKAGTDWVPQHLTVEKATSSRNALARAIFQRLFCWVVKKINDVLAQPRRASFIGVLDISGFEIFPQNSFEQLCINYTNERLQQFFNHHMFKLEQEEYLREKIEWTMMDFGLDSQPVIDLIDAKSPPGILALLDEQSFLGGAASDEQFLRMLNQHFGRGRPHPKYQEPRFDRVKDQKEFIIEHYAGPVFYNPKDWIDKNRDPLQRDLERCMRESTLSFVGKLFKENFGIAGGVIDDEGAPAAPTRPGAGNRRAGAGASFLTVGNQHKEQLQSLMTTLFLTHPHFVRCILPNHKKQPSYLEDKIVLQQLKCNGVLEGIRITRKGFPNRIVYAEFLKRYYFLVPGIQRATPDTKATVQILMEKLKVEKEKYQLGLTKIFFRTGVLAEIEEMREKKISEMIVNLQAASRAALGRRNYIALREKTMAATIIQANLRAFIEFRNWPWWKLFQNTRRLLKRVNIEAEKKKVEKELEATKELLEAEKKQKATIEAQLAEATSAIGDLSNQLRSTKADLQVLTQAKDGLEGDRKELEAKVSALEDDLSALKGREALLKEKLLDSEAEYKDLEDLMALEVKQKGQLTAMVKRFETELDEAKKAIDEQAQHISALDKAKAGVTNDLNTVTAQLDAETQAKGALEKTVLKMQREIKDLHGDLEKESTAKADLSKEKRAVEAELATVKKNLEAESLNVRTLENNAKKLQGMLDDLNARYDTETKNRAALEKAKKDLQRELDEVKDNLNEERSARENFEKKCKALQGELVKLEKQIEDGLDQNSVIQATKMKTEAELKDLRAEVERLTQLVARLEKEKKALQIELDDVKKAMEALQKDKAALEKAKRTAESELEGLRERVEVAERDKAQNAQNIRRLTTENTQQKALLDELTAAKTTLEASAKSLETQLNDQHDEFDTVKRDKETLEKRKHALEGQMAVLSEQLEDEKKSKEAIEKRRRALEEDVTLLRGEIDDTENKLLKATTDLKARDSEVEELKKKLAAEIQAKDKALETARASSKTAEELRQVNDDLAAQNARFSNSNKKLQSDLEALADQKEIESKQRIALEKARVKTDADFKALKTKLDEQINLASEQYIQIKNLKEEEANMHRELEEADANLSNAVRGKKGLEVENAGLKDQIAMLEAKASSATAKAKQLEMQVQELERKLIDAGEGNVDSAIVVTKDQEISDLKAKLKTEQEAKAAGEEQRRAQRVEMQDLKANLEIALRAKEGFERSKKLLEEEATQARSSADLALSKARMLEETISNLQQQNRSLRVASVINPAAGEEAQRLQAQVGALMTQLDNNKKLLEESELQRKTLEAHLAEKKHEQEEEQIAKERLIKAHHALEVTVQEIREQLDEAEDRATSGETAKRKAEVELEDLKKRYDNELDLKQRIEIAKNALEKDVDKYKQLFEEERKVRLEIDRVKKRLETDVEELTVRLDTEVKAKTALDKAKRKIERDARVAKTKYDTDIGKAAELENANMKLEEELDEMRVKLDRETKSRLILEKAKQAFEVRFEDLSDTLENETKARGALEKERRELAAEIEDLKEQVEDFDEIKSDLEAAKRKVELEREELKKEIEKLQITVDDVEIAKSKYTREITELNERLAEEIAARSTLDKAKKRLDSELAEVTEKLDTEMKNKAKNEKTLRAVQRQLADAQKALTAAEAAAAKAAAGGANEQAQRRLRAELDDLRNELAKAQNDRKQMEIQRNELEEELKKSKEENTDLEERLNAILTAMSGGRKKTETTPTSSTRRGDKP